MEATVIDPDLDEVRRLAVHVAAQVHTRVHDGSTYADQRLLATADAITEWLTTDPAQVALETRMTRLEAYMATLAESMTRINDETNEIGTVVDGAVAAIQDLRTRLSDLDTAAAAELGEIADRLSGTSDRLSAVAADPNNPVPEPPVEPAPGV